MNQNIQKLIEISQYYGKDKAFVIAGGGNTSYKDNQSIWIKASGIALETIDDKGFVELSREKLKVVSTKQYSADSTQREAEVKQDLAAAIVSTGGNRPSVETSMHEVIDYAFVVHTHPTKVNAMMCSVSAEKTCSDLFGDEALFIPYTDPGYVLFKKVDNEIANFKNRFGKAPQLIFLENHGVFVAANTTDEIRELYQMVMNRIESKITNELPDSENKPFTSLLTDRIDELNPGFAGFTAKGISSDLISHFVASASAFKNADTSFTPDDIVYCKAHYLFVPAAQTEQIQFETAQRMIEQYKTQFGYLPKVIALEGKGVIGIEESLKSVLNVLEVYVNILKISFLSLNFAGPKFMNAQQIDFIDNWEVENYRRKMAKS